MTMTPVGHHWSLTFLAACLLAPIVINATPINRQVGISENVFITVQNDTYGIEQRVCSIDSMTYGDGETIPTSSPCEHCICRPPGFACTIISCEYRPGCKSFKRSNQCCPEYQCECEKDGKIYQNGEKIMDSNNPCEICYCQGGEIICAVIDCYWRSDCQPRYIENRCCPLYDHCPPPSNQGPFPRPTIPTTTTSSGFPWFNLSSAVYEIPTSSSVTPVPVFITSTAPTTTPTQPEPELVVVATDKTPVLVNILATAHEELLNETSAISEDSHPAQQTVDEVTEGISVPIQQNIQDTIPIEQTVVPVMPEIIESLVVNETAIPVIPVLNETISAPENQDVPVSTIPEVHEIVLEVHEKVPAIVNPEINETIPVPTIPVDVNEIVPVTTVDNSEVNETSPVVSNPEIINDIVPSNDGVTETVPINNEAINESVSENTNVNDALPVEETVDEKAPVIPDVPIVNEETSSALPTSPEVEDHESVVVVADDKDSVSVNAEMDNSVPLNDNKETSQTVLVSPEVNDNVPVLPEINETVVENPEVEKVHIPLNQEINQSMPVIVNEEVTETVPANDDVNESVSVSPELNDGVEIAQANDEINTLIPANSEIKDVTPVQEIEEKIQISPEVNETLPVYPPIIESPEINEIQPSIPTIIIPITQNKPVVPVVSEVQPDLPAQEYPSSISVQPSTPSMELDTLTLDPEVAVQIIPSPVQEIFETQLDSVAPPEVFSQVMENEKESSQDAQDTISQSENVVQVDDKVVSATESLPMVVASLQTETISGSHSSSSSASQIVVVPTEPILADEVINPTTTVEENADSSSTVSEISEVPTTGIPPSISFDEVDQLPVEEIEQTTVNKIQETPTTESSVEQQKPIPSIATILMPPKKEEPVELTSTDAPAQEQNPAVVEEIPVPIMELEPPTEEFISGGNNDEPESPVTTVSSIQENILADAPAIDNDQQDEPEATTVVSNDQQNIDEFEKTADEPTILGTYLPVPQQNNKPVVVDEVTTQQPSNIVEIHSSYNPSLNTPVQSVDTEFLEDSPVHIQGSDSSEVQQSSLNEESTTGEFLNDLNKPLGEDITVESVTNTADKAAADEPVVQTTIIPNVVAIESSYQVPSKESKPEIEVESEQEKVNDEPEIVVTSSTTPVEVPEVVTTPPEVMPSAVVPLAVNANDNTFEIIPPQTDNMPSSPEIQNQIRDQEEQVVAQQDDAVQEIPSKLEEKPHIVQNDAPGLISDDDTVEIFAENFTHSEEATTQPSEVSVDKKAESEVHLASVVGNEDDTVEISAADAPSKEETEVTTSTSIVPQKNEEPVPEEDEPEEMHPDDQHDDDQEQVILPTTQAYQNDDAVASATSASIVPSENESDVTVNHDDNEQEDEILPTTVSPIQHDSEDEEIHRDESDHVEQEDESFIATTTTRASLVQNDDADNSNSDSDSQSPMTTTIQPAESMNKVQKVADQLKSKDEEKFPAESSSESKFRLDLAAFDDSEESGAENKLVQGLSSQEEEVQSTPTSVNTKLLANSEIVFDEAQQTPTHSPSVESFQDQTTQKIVKLSRDDIDTSDLTTTSQPANLRDDLTAFTTTSNPGRSDSEVTNSPQGVTSSDSESQENFINDEGFLGETTVRTPIDSFRHESTQELTTAATIIQNETEVPVVIRSDLSTNDFVAVPTGSPLGFAAVYRDDGLTTIRAEFREDSDATTVESIIFDEEQKSQDENLVSTTLQSEIVRGKSEDIAIEATTSQDLLNDESSVVTTILPNSSESVVETSTVRIAGRLDQMIIPEKGFPQIDPVAHEMIPRKEDKLARLDLNDDDSWFYQTFNKIRQLSGLFPTANRQRKLTRQPRDVSEQEEANPPKPKTYFKKTKKATEEEVKKSPRRKSYLPSRSFLFF